jgi:predicted phage tail protein
VGVCSGDSGGPTFATNAQGNRLLLGVNSGSAGGCVAGFTGAYLMIGFTAIDYLDLVNQALTSAGYPTVPSTPQAIELTAVNNTVEVTWQPPAISPETVVGYEVLDPAGNVVCETTSLNCRVSGLATGTFSYTVRAKNSQSEGNALPASLTASVVPPAQLKPPRLTKKAIQFTTLAGTTSAVVNQYRVIDATGKRICTIRSFNPAAKQLGCPLPTKVGKYRFRVTAVTEMGQTPPSGLSKARVIS